MTRARWRLPAWGALAVAIGCTSQLPKPSSFDLEVARARWPDATLEDLDGGRMLFVQNCAGCHDLPRPGDLAPEDWTESVEAMRVEAEVELTDEEAARIQRYLYVASQAAQNSR